MQTIIVDSDRATQDILKLNLEAFVETDVISRQTSNEVLEVLSIIPDIKLIIMKEAIADDAIAERVMAFLEERHLDIPLIIIGDGDAGLYPGQYILPIDASWQEIIQVAFEVLGVKNPEDIKLKPKFIPIDTRFFYEINTAPCDIYIRIKKNQESFDYQYVKLVHANDNFDHGLIEKYEAQGIITFFINQDYHQYFVTTITRSLLEKLDSPISTDDRIIANDNVYRIIMSKVDNLELDEEAIQLTHGCMKSLRESISGTTPLKDLIGRLFANKISYAYQKAHLTFLIAISILRKIEGHSKEDINTIGYTAFFADITLKTEKQHQILNYQNFITSDLSLAEKSVVEFHARQIAKMVEETNLFSGELGQILREHHGTKDGMGFPKNFPRTLHYLSYLYITADYFVSTLLHPRKPTHKAEILKMIELELNSKQFKPFINVLKGKLE